MDFKLAVRMLVRYPGLTLVGVIGMALGIAIATAAFTISNDVLDSALPLEDGDRIVSIVNRDVATNNREQRTIYEFGAWREQLRSVQEVGAFRTVGRNLVLKGSQPQPVSVAEVTAPGFNVARVSPTMGRYLRPEDERAGAPDVVVIGHEVWSGKFGSDPSILDRQIQLGDRLPANRSSGSCRLASPSLSITATGCRCGSIRRRSSRAPGLACMSSGGSHLARPSTVRKRN